MGTQIAKTIVSTYDYSSFRWEDLRENIPRDSLIEWEKDNPMPPTRHYDTFGDFLVDFGTATGTLAFPENEDNDFLGWLVDMIDELFS